MSVIQILDIKNLGCHKATHVFQKYFIWIGDIIKKYVFNSILFYYCNMIEITRYITQH